MPAASRMPQTSALSSSTDASGEPVSILAALIGALREPERYSIVTRDGELFITPSG